MAAERTRDASSASEWGMAPTAAVARPQVARPTIAEITSRLLVACLDVRSVWSIGHDPGDADVGASPCRLLAFANAATLQRLRMFEHLHDPDVELLVVTNGEDFATAWGPSKLSGSLARWGWRRTSLHEAYYDESRWAQREGSGAVVRVRRKAFLVWQAEDEAPARGETVV